MVAHTVVLDWKRTLYDPEHRSLMDGAKELLDFLSERALTVVLVGKGDEDMHAEVDRLGVRGYFDTVVFREGAKGPELFQPFVDRQNASSTLVIGDRARSEIAVGSELGATTVWVRQGKFAVEEPELEVQKPTHVVALLSEVKPLLELLLP
jgi:FMN phosphatase YigB (HAD superfamily)